MVTPKRWLRRSLRVFRWVVRLVIFVYDLMTFAFGQVWVWSTTTKSVCPQPETFPYDGARYSVFVRERSYVSLLQDRPVYAVVGTTPVYGVFIELNKSTADGVTCEWTADAVEIFDRHGIVHRVPASTFTGGR